MKKTSKWLALMIAIIMVASVGLVGCGGGSSTDGGKTAAEPQELHMILTSEPPSMDAQLTTDANSFIILNAVQEGLVRPGPKGIEPGIAEKWEVSEDGKTYTFHLRKDAQWSNGDPINAQSFIDGWARAIDAANAAQYANMVTDYIKGAKEYYDYTNYLVLKNLYETDKKKYEEATKDEEGKVPTPDVAAFGKPVANPQPVALDSVGFKKTDDFTLVVELTQPTGWFLELTSFATYLPFNKKFYEANKDKYATEADMLLYNGPFVLKEWAHEQKLTLVKNDKYWDKENVKLDTLTFDVVKETDTALSLYEAGDVDRAGVSRENVPVYKNDPNFKTFAEMTHAYLNFNTTKKPFNNAKVRKALSIALDRQGYVDTTLNNGSTPAFALVPEGFLQYSGSSKTFREASKEKYGQLFTDNNPTEAKKLLEEGLKEEGMDIKNFKFELLGDEGDSARKSAEFLKSNWKQALGIDITTPGVPFQERLKRSREQQFEVVLSLWGPDYNDPLTWLFLFETNGTYNDGKYSNPKYDELVAKAKTEIDADKRLGYFMEAEKILIQDDAGVAPLYNRNLAYLMQPYVKGFMEKSFGAQWEFKWTYIEGKQK